MDCLRRPESLSWVLNLSVLKQDFRGSTVRHSGLPVHGGSGVGNAGAGRARFLVSFRGRSARRDPKISRLKIGDAALDRKLAEEAFKASWSDDLENAGLFITGVPEGMPLIARLEHKVVRFGKHDFVA